MANHHARPGASLVAAAAGASLGRPRLGRTVADTSSGSVPASGGGASAVRNVGTRIRDSGLEQVEL
jgi:hypothetical protein